MSAQEKSASKAGVPVACGVCRHGRFFERWLLMNTRGATFLNWEFANKGALCLVCDRCSHVHWFHTPELVHRVAPGEEAPPDA